MAIDEFGRDALLRGRSRLVFVAVSTRQGVANVSPILELAEPGDEVLWLESRLARERRWTAGPRGVLRDRGVTSREPVAISDVPAQIASTVTEALSGIEDAQPVLVYNGGTKLTEMGLERVTHNNRPAPVIYGDVDPPRLWILPEGGLGAHDVRPYRSTTLGLVEILECAGYRHDESRARCIWRLDQKVAPPGPARFSYADNHKATAKAHELESIRAAYRASAESGFGRYAEALEIGREDLDLWSRDVAKVSLPEGELNATKCRGQLTGVFDAAAKLSARCARPEDEPPPAVAKLGELFEEAVTSRVYDWLSIHGEAYSVIEAWVDICIFEGKLKTPSAQWDLVLVVSGGVIINLECKSFECEMKDIDARILNLQNSTSSVARMVICSPVYTAYWRTSWFRQTLKKTDYIRERAREWIGFTLKGQPEAYRRFGPAGVVEDRVCPPFESSLAALLARSVASPPTPSDTASAFGS